MNTTACNYAALRFLPYRETGEFVNVGVALLAAKEGYFGYRCEERQPRRVEALFPELDPAIYREAVAGVRRYLEATAPQFAPGTAIAEALRRFHELTRVREGLLTFGPVGAMLADEPERALETLFQRLVLRENVERKKHPEQVS